MIKIKEKKLKLQFNGICDEVISYDKKILYLNTFEKLTAYIFKVLKEKDLKNENYIRKNLKEVAKNISYLIEKDKKFQGDGYSWSLLTSTNELRNYIK